MAWRGFFQVKLKWAVRERILGRLPWSLSCTAEGLGNLVTVPHVVKSKLSCWKL